MSTGTYVLEADWGNDGAWAGEDIITADVFELECRRGRDYASQLTGRAVAGRLSALLDNRAGKYSSFNSASPIFGNIVPGRKVRLRSTAPSAQTLWVGFLDRIQPAGRSGTIPVVRLEASGPLSRIAGRQISPAAQGSAASGTHIGAILDAVSWPAGDRDIATGQTTITAWYVDKIDALIALRQIEETELGFIFESAAGLIVYQDRHTRLKAPYTTSQVTFSDAGAATYRYRGLEQQDPLREIFNEIIATVAPLETEGAPKTLWTLRGESPTIDAGQSRTWVAFYPSPETDPNTGAYVSSWTTPVGTTDVTVTGVAIGDIGIAVTKQATTMNITLTNNGAATATVTLLQARGTAVVKKTATRITASDATSQTAYGLRTYRLPGPWLPDTVTAQNFTDYLVSRYKDPHATLVLEINANRSNDILTSVLTREVSDRVTIVAASSQAQMEINDDFFIEAVAHRVSNRGVTHTTVWELSDAAADAGYWVLGVSALGTDTKLAY